MRDNNFPVIQFINISKRFNSKAILSKINLTIYRGEIIGITGPIGAGKTTLVQIALGLITPDVGSVEINGISLETNRQLVLQQVNFASSSLRLNGYSSVMENLLTFARLYGVKHAKETIAKIARSLRINHLLGPETKVYRLSAGENSTVNLCKALLNSPNVIFFDEITAHMDPSGVIQFYNEMRKIRASARSVILISQNLNELMHTCDRIVFMKQGKILRIFPRHEFDKLNKQYE